MRERRIFIQETELSSCCSWSSNTILEPTANQAGHAVVSDDERERHNERPSSGMYAANPVLVSRFFLSVKESLVMDCVLAIHQIPASNCLQGTDCRVFFFSSSWNSQSSCVVVALSKIFFSHPKQDLIRTSKCLSDFYCNVVTRSFTVEMLKETLQPAETKLLCYFTVLYRSKSAV
jgi:hypothetical protein